MQSPSAVIWRTFWARSLQRDSAANHSGAQWDAVRELGRLRPVLTFQRELFGWGGPSAPLLIPPEGIRALCFLRAISGCNLLLVRALRMLLQCKAGFLLEDAALLQQTHCAGSYQRCVVVWACYNACQWESGLCAELFSSAPVLCYILTTLKISVLQASVFSEFAFSAFRSWIWVLFSQCFRRPLNVNSVSIYIFNCGFTVNFLLFSLIFTFFIISIK